MSLELFNKLDNIIEKINQHKVEPAFSNEINSRKEVNKNYLQNDRILFEQIINLILYSQNAKANKVEDVINSGILKNIFFNFDISKITHLNPCDIIDNYWEEIKGIRQQTKIFQIIMLARKINRLGSFIRLLNDNEIPIFIKSDEDISRFWRGFKRLLNIMEKNKVPFFRSITTLLHLLLHLGYDCLKPDTIIMNISTHSDFKVADKKTGSKNLINTVRFFQEYCVSRNLRVPVIDFYLLIYGGQSGIKKFVDSKYY